MDPYEIRCRALQFAMNNGAGIKTREDALADAAAYEKFLLGEAMAKPATPKKATKRKE